MPDSITTPAQRAEALEWDDYDDRCFICGCSGQPCDCLLSDDESDHEGEDNED